MAKIPHFGPIWGFQNFQKPIFLSFLVSLTTNFFSELQNYFCSSQQILESCHKKYRFYGNNIKIMIDEAVKWKDGEMKEALIYTIANHMKKCFLNWNKDSVTDVVIFDHLFELSDGKIDIRNSDEVLLDSSVLIRPKRKFVHKKSIKKNNRPRKRY